MINRIDFGNIPQNRKAELNKRKHDSNINTFKTTPSFNNFNNNFEPLKQSHGLSFKGSFFSQAGKIIKDEVIPQTKTIFEKNSTTVLHDEAVKWAKKAFGDEHVVKLLEEANKTKIVKNFGSEFVENIAYPLADILNVFMKNGEKPAFTRTLGKDILYAANDLTDWTVKTVFRNKKGIEGLKALNWLSAPVKSYKAAIQKEKDILGLNGFIQEFPVLFRKTKGNIDEGVKEINKNFGKKFGDFSKSTFSAVADRFWNRIESGFASALFLAADAANLTMILKNDKKEANKEYKARFKQETGRVLLSSALMYLSLGSFKKFTNKSFNAALGLTLVSTLVAEVVGRKMAGKRILPMSVKDAEKLAAKNNETQNNKTEKTQAQQNNTPPKTNNLAFNGNETVKTSQTKEKDSFKLLKIIGGVFAASIALHGGGHALKKAFGQMNTKFNPQELAKIIECLNKADNDMATSIFKELKTALKEVDGFGDEALKDINSLVKHLNGLGDKNISIGKVSNRVVNVIGSDAMQYHKQVVNVLAFVHNNATKFAENLIDNVSGIFMNESAKLKKIKEFVKDKENDYIEAVLKEFKENQIPEFCKKIGSTFKEVYSETLSDKHKILLKQISEKLVNIESENMDETVKKVLNGFSIDDTLKAKLQQKITERLPEVIKAGENKSQKAIIANLYPAFTDSVKHTVFKSVEKALKEDKDKGVNSLYKLVVQLKNKPAARKTEPLEVLNNQLKKLRVELRKSENTEQFEDKITELIKNKKLSSNDISSAQNYSATTLSTWTKITSSALTAGFLVSDSYNLVMEKTGGKDKKMAAQKAQERAMQEVSRNIFSTYFVKLFNNMLMPFANRNLLFAAVNTVANVGAYESTTRAALGIPITVKTKEQIMKKDAENAAKTGFWGGYFKFMSYVTGKKSLSSRVNKTEDKKMETQPSQQTISTKKELFKAFNQA